MTAITSSNRTFMELKSVLRMPLYMVLERSNRTFMELKSSRISLPQMVAPVLIVPLWN